MINQKENSLFRHFGEELTVIIAGTPKPVKAIFNEATTGSSSNDNRADVIDTVPSAICMAADIEGVKVGDSVTRGAKTFYVIDIFGDEVLRTLNLSEDLP